MQIPHEQWCVSASSWLHKKTGAQYGNKAHE